MKPVLSQCWSCFAVPLLLVGSVLLLSACSSSDDNAATQGGAGDQYAFVSGATPTFDAGQIERFTLGASIESSGTYPATLSDIRVRTDGESVYELGRFNLDTITRYSTDNLLTPTYQYSVLDGDEISPNPYDIVFVDNSKAYIVRYGSPTVWIVNPSAATEAEFKIGELDLSAYDTDAPNASDALIVDGRLYILMQRLDGFSPIKSGYVAVFDTDTDTEVDTGLGSNGLTGIALSSLNPESMQYIAATDEILVLGRGNIFVEFNELPGDPYQGGIESISRDGDAYTLNLLLDDGSEGANNGFFSNAVAVDASRGYVVTYTGFGNTTLRSYNVTTGLLDDGVVAGLESIDITTLAVGPQGRVWVGLGGDVPGFTLIDPADNSIAVEKVATQFVPNFVVFTDGVR